MLRIFVGPRVSVVPVRSPDTPKKFLQLAWSSSAEQAPALRSALEESVHRNARNLMQALALRRIFGELPRLLRIEVLIDVVRIAHDQTQGLAKFALVVSVGDLFFDVDRAKYVSPVA